MKKRLLPLAVVALAALSVVGNISAKKNDTKPATDPVIMTINGKQIMLSEFEYLYNKNNSQQTQPTTVDEYLDMFVNYKLKVAEAEATGVDTTAAFKAEYARYRDDLAAPYMVDHTVEDALVQEVYDHFQENRYVNYIMMYGGRMPAERLGVKERIDSIRAEIVAGRADFAQMADRFSVDKNHGVMGWMKANRYPYAFEKAVYAVPVGEVSEVQEFPFGFFLVRVDSVRQDPGQVHARHILKVTRNVSDSLKNRQRERIDSIYELVIAGADFGDMARRESEDPGSQSKGGDLGWFSFGDMVPEFDRAVFAMADGDISRPIATSFGYHIIQRLASRPGASLETLRPDILNVIQHDERANMAADASVANYAKLYKAKTDAKVMKAVKKDIEKAGTYDAALAALKANTKVVASVADRKITVAEVAEKMTAVPDDTPEKIYTRFEKLVQSMLNEQVRDYAIDRLPAEHPELANLLAEYRDGMLLFEVSNANVWERSTSDTEGLNAFFQAHRSEYTWDKPHYKGYVVFTPNDSVMGEVKNYLDTCTLAVPEAVIAARQHFGRQVKIEKVLAAQGDNAITDFLLFGGDRPNNTSTSWPSYFAFGGVMLEQPEEAADVKGAVAADYQQQLDREWIEALRARYPVQINQEVVNSLK